MKITFVMQFASLAGGNRVIALYARKLEERGHEVHVISQPFIPPPRWKRVFYRLLGKPHKVKLKKASPLFAFLGPRHKVLDRPRPVQAADLPDGDAVFATWWRTAPVVAGLPASKGAKFYLLQDYEMFDYLPRDEVAATYGLPLRKIAVSSYIADALSRHHGQDEVVVVPNAVDLDQFQAPPRGKADRPTVGFLYSPTERKQISLAIEAARQARAALPDLRVLAFGASESMPHVPLPEWVEYHRAPPQDEIPRLYAACDMWLFTSKHEGFGLPLLEAMACRTPVLATRAGAAPDLIDGTNGVLLDPDAALFSAEIQRMAHMGADQWRMLSQGAHDTAQRYSWDEATDQLLRVITAEPTEI